MEVNISSTVQTSISSSRNVALNSIRREIVEDIRESMVDLLVDAMLGWLGPGISSFAEPAWLPRAQVGNLFEETVQEILCQVVPAGVLHFEVGIDQRTGLAIDDGYGGCPPKRRNFAGVKNRRRPDIVVNQGSPMAEHPSLLISEVKRGIGSFYRAWKGKQQGQWLAISEHSKEFAYPPHAVVLIAFEDGKRYHRRFLERILRKGQHYGIVINAL
jgi:hypothetical protein